MKVRCMYKLIVGTVLITGIIGSVVDARELRSAGAAPQKTPWGMAAEAFVAKLAELSGGQLTVKHFHNSQLGDEQTTIRQVVRGRLDMGFFSNTATSLVVPEFGLLASPYAFEDAGQAACVADKYLLATYNDAMDTAGVVPVAFMEVGQQIIMSKKPIKTPADLNGIKIRTAPSKTDTLFMQDAGANTVPLGTTDTMPALKTGNIDAITSPIVYGIAVGYHKEAPHVTVTNHVHQIGAVLVSAKTWNTLSEQEQDWIREAAQQVNNLRQSVRAAEVALLKEIVAEKNDDVEVYYPSEAELALWRDVAVKVQPQIVAELGGGAAATWAAIEQARQNCAQ